MDAPESAVSANAAWTERLLVVVVALVAGANAGPDLSAPADGVSAVAEVSGAGPFPAEGERRALASGAGETRNAESLLGETTSVEPARHGLTLKTDSGESVVVSVVDGSPLLRAVPGAKSLADAAPLTLEDVGVGDRVMVRGTFSEDHATFQARQVVVMTKTDIARRRDAEGADWRRRGVSGVVTAVDAAKGEVTLRIGRGTAAAPLVISTAGREVAFRRYAPDSVKFSDARPSGLDAVKVGDELRALGERAPDSPGFLAEQVVFGSFRLVTGTVASLEPAKNQVVLRDEESGAKLTVTVGTDARVRRLPPELVARLARRGEEEDGGPGGLSRPRPGGGERQRWTREPGSGPEDLLERLAAITLADLKSGDRILVSSTRGNDATRLNAIALVTGLPALSAPTGGGRGGRGADFGLPPELMDLGLSIP